MEITVNEIQWTPDDVVALINFLNTQSGAKLASKLAEMTPPLLSEGDTNKILIRSGEVLGMQNTIRNLLSLTRVIPVENDSSDASEYPSLTDDARWIDGQKIRPQ
jgi:hypothetical protein